MTTVARQTIRRPGGSLERLRATLVRLPFVATLLLGLAGAGCGNGDDTASLVAVKPPAMDATTTPIPDSGAPDQELPETSTVEAGVAAAMFSSAPIDLGVVACSASGTATFTINNTGTGALAVSVTTTGTAFAVTPTSLVIPEGGPAGTLTITATVPGSSAAGVPLAGSL